MVTKMMMLNKTTLGHRMYDAWRDGTPVGEEMPPEWKTLTRPQQARWRYVAESIGEYLSQAMNARTAA